MDDNSITNKTIEGQNDTESKKQMVFPEPATKEHLFEVLCKSKSSGAILLTNHARQQMSNREIDMNDISKIFEQRKSAQFEVEWDTSYETWKYIITGYNIDNIRIRVVVRIIRNSNESLEAILSPRVLIITAHHCS